MKINIGKYSKQKKMPRVYGPRRRINKKALTKKIVSEQTNKEKWVKRKKLFLYLIVLLFFVGISVGIWRFHASASRVKNTSINNNSNICDNIFNPTCWSGKFKPNLKQTNGVTNMLVVGLDTRPVGEGSGLQNTDSIIVASINHKLKKTMLISIPRDMLVDVHINGYKCCTMKINAVYSLASARTDVDDGLELLASNIERLLGIDIQYKATVNFEAVKDGVDAVGGIDVDVSDTMTVIYPQSIPPYKNVLIKFKKGQTHMNGVTALTWARFRKVYRGPMSYASDFSRAARQQQVIGALKNNALKDSGDLAAMARKYWNIYGTISSNVRIKSFDFEDVLAGVSLVTEYDTNPIHVVLDPMLGGLNHLIVTGHIEDAGVGYHILPKNNTWVDIRNYISKIWEYPGVYNDEAVVVTSNRTGIGLGIDSPIMMIENADIPFGGYARISEYSKKNNSGVVIYDFSKGKMVSTRKVLSKYFPGAKFITDTEGAHIRESGYNEDFKVVINKIDKPK